jgi:hypothetical protein
LTNFNHKILCSFAALSRMKFIGVILILFMGSAFARVRTQASYTKCFSDNQCHGSAIRTVQGSYSDCASKCASAGSSYFSASASVLGIRNCNCFGDYCDLRPYNGYSVYSINGFPCTTPSEYPTYAPSVAPTPTTSPSFVPTVVPTAVPSCAPTTSPSFVPTVVPTVVPSCAPTVTPTAKPSVGPSSVSPTAPCVTAYAVSGQGASSTCYDRTTYFSHHGFSQPVTDLNSKIQVCASMCYSSAQRVPYFFTIENDYTSCTCFTSSTCKGPAGEGASFAGETLYKGTSAGAVNSCGPPAPVPVAAPVAAPTVTVVACAPANVFPAEGMLDQTLSCSGTMGSAFDCATKCCPAGGGNTLPTFIFWSATYCQCKWGFYPTTSNWHYLVGQLYSVNNGQCPSSAT